MPKATTNKYGEKVNDFKEKFVEGVTFDSMYAITMYATKLKIIRKKDNGMFYVQLMRMDKKQDGSGKKVWGRPSPWYPIGTKLEEIITSVAEQMPRAKQGMELMVSSDSCVIFNKETQEYEPYDMVAYKAQHRERYAKLKEQKEMGKKQTPLEQVDPFADEPHEPEPLPFSDDEEFPF